jgi:hypothetical protein
LNTITKFLILLLQLADEALGLQQLLLEELRVVLLG